jgi:hypothetical protein
MRIYSCDHCGAPYEISGIRNNGRPERWASINVNVTARRQYDLCPACVTELEEFLTKNRTKQ